MLCLNIIEFNVILLQLVNITKNDLSKYYEYDIIHTHVRGDLSYTVQKKFDRTKS